MLIVLRFLIKFVTLHKDTQLQIIILPLIDVFVFV